MPIISVTNLTKTFRFKVKKEGFKNSLKSMFKAKFKTIKAVDAISFSIEKGETIGFIGPNGAGKSTTIKMLTGILFPTAGRAKVCDLTPWEKRQKLAFKIGTVFGQKPQLWYHLPAIDTFNLFAKIYELDMTTFKKRLNWLIKQFETKDLIHTPVRKLSLGQRMRCEIVVSLIHSPEVIFLDEPTIGLDVIAKQQIRDTIKHINKTEGTTIFLTSHDVGDIEKLTKRTIIINKGKIIFDGKTRSLRWDYIHSKIISIRFKDPSFKIPPINGVKIIKRSEYGLKIQVDTSKADVENVLKRIMNKNKIADITILDPPLEEIIAKIYKNKK